MTQEVQEGPAQNRERRRERQGMRLFSDDVWEPITRMREEIDQMYEDFSRRPFGSKLSRRIRTLAGPAIELKDAENEYQLIAEVPGVKSEDIDIKIVDGVLRVSGETREEKEEEGEGFFFSERQHGHFERAVQLPGGVDEDNVTAETKDGLLTVHMPKTEEAKQEEKIISVKAN